MRKLLIGSLAGLISAPVALLITYLVGIAITAFKTRELLTTLLVAGSFLPLMLLFVLLIPTLAISFLSGVIVGLCSRFIRHLAWVGPVVGLVLGEIVLTVVLPFIVRPKPDDFTSLVTNPLLAGCYGLVLGGIIVLFFRLLNRGT